MHAVIRVYHTTRSDIAADDNRWRIPCKPGEQLVYDGNLSAWKAGIGDEAKRRGWVNHGCGEEFYSPFDVDFLLATLRYPSLMLLGLRQLQRVGVQKALEVFVGPHLASLLVEWSGLSLSMAIGIVLAMCACCARRGCCACSVCRRRQPHRHGGGAQCGHGGRSEGHLTQPVCSSGEYSAVQAAEPHQHG
jgi:hypothetical protein